MYPKDIPLFRTDLTGTNPDNHVTQEYYRRVDLSPGAIFALRSGPFYTESLILTKMDGTPLVEETDYAIMGIAAELTAFVKNKEVSVIIKILDNTITEWYADYQVVGHYSLINRELITLINRSQIVDAVVDWNDIDGKPTWFDPETHQHDIRYDIHSFGDLIECINRIKEVKEVLPSGMRTQLDHFNGIIFDRIADYERMLLRYIQQHDSHSILPYTNAHGLTKKQMGLDKVDNFETATLLDVLDGFREDMHVTCDYLKRGIDSVGKVAEDVIAKGSLPLLRYPEENDDDDETEVVPTIFEGIGGDDFNVGVNIEHNRTATLLMNRNDGHVNALYYMSNKDYQNDYPAEKWKFRGKRYMHEVAIKDGVQLRHIIRGSDGRFLIVGGPDITGKTVWYQAEGKSTLDWRKHRLIRLPDEIEINASSILVTQGYPDKVFLFTRHTQKECFTDGAYRRQGFKTPINVLSNGLSLDSEFGGFRCWECDIREKTWLPIHFLYNQCGFTDRINSDMYMPFRTVIVKSGKHDYKLKQFEYIHTTPINSWNIKTDNEAILGKYDRVNHALGIKYIYQSVGKEGLIDDGVNSFGFILKDRSIDEDGELHYHVEPGKSLSQPCTFDNTDQHREYSPDKIQSTGQGTIAWLGDTRVFRLNPSKLGTFPISLGHVNLADTECIINPTNWATLPIATDTKSLNVTQCIYNDENPGGLSPGTHSTCWVQLNPDDKDTFGSISVMVKGDNKGSHLWFRRQPVLSGNGTPNKPRKVHRLLATKSEALGYKLDNLIYPINHEINTCFVTNIFTASKANRRDQYVKHIIGHQPFKEGCDFVNTDNAVTVMGVEWAWSKNEDGYRAVPTKQCDLTDALKDVLIPYMVKNHKGDKGISFINALSTMRIGYTNVQGTHHNNLLILSFHGFGEDNGVYTLSMTFDLSGGTIGDDGVIQHPTVTPVGDVYCVRVGTLSTDKIGYYHQENVTFKRDASTCTPKSRDLVHQYANGLTHVNLQWDVIIETTKGSHTTGISYLVDEKGITDAKPFDIHEDDWSHHPYYGCMANTNGLNGSCELGLSYATNISQFDDHVVDVNNKLIGRSVYLDSAFTIELEGRLGVVLSGSTYYASKTVIDLHDVVSDPANRTFYVYLTLINDTARYRTVLTPLVETPCQALILTINTTDDGIYEMIGDTVFTMNNYRISDIVRGSAIPAANGYIYEVGRVREWVVNHRK